MQKIGELEETEGNLEQSFDHIALQSLSRLGCGNAVPDSYSLFTISAHTNASGVVHIPRTRRIGESDTSHFHTMTFQSQEPGTISFNPDENYA